MFENRDAVERWSGVYAPTIPEIGARACLVGPQRRVRASTRALPNTSSAVMPGKA